VDASITPKRSAEKRPFDIELAMPRLREAIRPFPKAALFALAEEGFDAPFELLMACITTHPELQRLRLWTLFTRDAHGLYRQFGFAEPRHPERVMEIITHPYASPA